MMAGAGVRRAAPRGHSCARARARASNDEEAPRAPDGYLTFAVDRVIRLPIREREGASVRAWLREPSNFIAVVFGAAEARERSSVGARGGRTFDVCVNPRELFGWEITPEFAIEAIPGDERGRAVGASDADARARLIGEGLRFAGDRTKLPPGFKSMGVWAFIDARVGVDESVSTDLETTVATEVKVRIAADIPGILKAIPGFSSAGVMAIAKSIDIVRGGITEATQATYDAWAQEQQQREG